MFFRLSSPCLRDSTVLVVGFLNMVTSPGHYITNGTGQLSGGGQPALELAGEPWHELVFGDADGIGFGLERELHFHVVLLGAENNADGGLVVWGAFLLVEEVQV